MSAMLTPSITTPGTVSVVVAVSLLTAEEFVKEYENKHAELVEGVVKELTMPFAKHGYICMEIGALIRNHVKTNDLGRVMGHDSFVKTRSNPDSVRGPNISYYSFERLPKGEIPEGLLSVPPDLVVKVRSPSDGWSEMFIKVGEYISVGVRAVVILDPATKTASVYREDILQQTFRVDEELIIPEVLPSFAVMVRRFFE